MAELDLPTNVISKNNTGFPEWLDFTKMRQQGIDYLGELSGNIWTDHNSHDPGITILEVLCYALLDLGYRTSLPAKDLFARDPADTLPENNFFTPAAILGCNPLTITDFRKLLIDVPGVKNAWLEPADDITIESLCSGSQSQGREKGFLNGLYHVYIDAEPGVLYKKDLPANMSGRTVDDVKKDVTKLLMAHRNLCEDFFDIKILCKQKVGVCADITLRTDADAEKVLVRLIEKLRDFLSPAPQFYRLKQLLEKGRSIEQIFEGRPIDLTQSHGFVDIEEFEKIVLRKEIHISDLYNAISSVEGIAAVKNVSLRNSDGSACSGTTPWVFNLYTDHVPELDLLASGFTFSGSRGSLIMDTQKFSKYLAANPYTDGKALMSVPSANLDALLDQGNYREALDNHYPIENDFPKVYGIADGSLPDDVPAPRRAQALQLRGYLLFFDTVLAGYLSQLKNIRNLFALTSPGADREHTYFIGQTTDRPGLEQLVPFSLAEIQPDPTERAFPVCKRDLEDIQATGKADWCTGEGEFNPYTFCSSAERDIAIRQLIEDLQNENFTDYLFTNKSGCWSYYFVTSSERFAIVGKEFYQKESDARSAASTLRYLCTNEKSFRCYTSLDKERFSFHVVPAIDGYWNYLRQLTENETLFQQRRNGFLDHLLARFAETFSDYALLAYSFESDAAALQRSSIRYKEQFLSAYPQLSSMRGKGYDYQRNGWCNDNVSGVEMRFEAYAGIGTGRQESLCHFEVAEFDEQTIIRIKSGDQDMMISNSSFQSRDEGIDALNMFLKASVDPANYTYAIARLEARYEAIVQAGDLTFRHPATFETEAEAREAGARLQRMFSTEPMPSDIIPVQFEHTLLVVGGEDQWKRKDAVINREQLFAPSADALADFKNAAQWMPEKGTTGQADIVFNTNPDKTDELIDIAAFEPYENRVDVRKNITIYKYTVSDRDRTFFFISEQEYESEADAHENMLRLLFRLADSSHYEVSKVAETEYVLKITTDDKILAIDTIEFSDEAAAKAAVGQIVAYVQQHCYRLVVDTRPVRWKFDLGVAMPGTGNIRFTSGNTEYTDRGRAVSDAARITAPDDALRVSVRDNILELRDKKHPKSILAYAELAPDADPKAAAELTEHFLSFKISIDKALSNPRSEISHRMVLPDSVSRRGNFGYRLVHKDNYQAWYGLDGDFTDSASRAKYITSLYKQYASEGTYLRLLYGDSVVNIRTDARTQAVMYHFCIRSRYDEKDPNGLVLFESVKGYTSAAEAVKAFEQQHVRILTFAGDATRYGTWISFEEVFSYSTGKCGTTEAQVFIPAGTMQRFGYNNEYARTEFIALSDTFPVRRITTSDPRFATLFLCGEKSDQDTEDCCSSSEEADLYFFQYKREGDSNAWISQSYFATAKEAMLQFNFFLLLLRYKGNYNIRKNECDCRWRVSVREILAESKRRFFSEEEAWGREGVEKFICTSQSGDAFPIYQREEDCSFSFFTACGRTGLIHPCTYDTSVARDEALQRLYKASREVFENYEKGNPDPWEETANEQGELRCDYIIGLIEQFLKDGEIKNIKNVEGTKPVSYEDMKRLAYYFPVRRRKLETPRGGYQYYLHINLPGFHATGGTHVDPCGCEPDLECCTPWISECCFNSCDEALAYYYKAIECLAEKEHYYPVMDCQCNTYGIRFHCDCITGEQTPNDQSNGVSQTCCSEVVAFNPQHYTTPAMACDAVARARRFINAEGLHLVEHILLRPHCREGDCQCLIDRCLPDNCQENFEWTVSANDPCTKDERYRFVPGADPYSFVATVVLPAWPERFRKKENREALEQLLYREMPAHIMARILWLTPQELCRFESLYRSWTKWLAQKPVCTEGQPACGLIEFLFKSDFHCFDCDECQPCAPPESSDLCQFSRAYDADPNAYVNAINALYCWNTICSQSEPGRENVMHIASRANETVELHIPEGKHVMKTALSEPVNKEATVVELTERATAPLSADAVQPEDQGREEAERRIDARFHGYRSDVHEIAESSGNVAAGLAISFLNQSMPDFESYRHVVETVMANKRLPDNRRLLSAKEKSALIAISTWYYLDRYVLRRRVSDNELELRELFKRLNKKGLLPEFKNWKSKDLTQAEPEAPVNEVKKLFDKS